MCVCVCVCVCVGVCIHTYIHTYIYTYRSHPKCAHTHTLYRRWSTRPTSYEPVMSRLRDVSTPGSVAGDGFAGGACVKKTRSEEDMDCQKGL